MTRARVAFAALALAACTDREVIGANGDGRWVELRLGVARQDIDLLFVIDNSPSMAPKQAELARRFPDLLALLGSNAPNGQPAHFHVGVVTTDLGAQSFNLGSQCRPGGDGARLQALGAAATPDCRPPTGGARFIDYDQLTGSGNLPQGQDLATTLRCLAQVGDAGCGFEQPLEAAYLALSPPPVGPPENAGFLRDQALLAVMFLTDEDDCSAPPDGDLFDPNAVGTYGPLLSYRCTQFGLECGTPPAPPPYGVSTPPLDPCVPVTDGKLYSVGRYLDFFRLPKSAGGVKPFPGDAFLFAVAGPPAPVMVLTANLKAPPGTYVPCAGPVDGVNCGTVLQHSCVSVSDSSFFADPAVRLAAVVSATQAKLGASICDTDYRPAMMDLAATVTSFQAGNGCIPAALGDPTQPDCQVSDDVMNPDGTVASHPLPWCPDAHDAPPCWRIDPEGNCAAVLDAATNMRAHPQLVIDRAAPAPADSVPHARCVIAP
ncbi:MAG TPA: hypothetical protein VFF06_35640 [Polyangia bacterium]|nr:hypothetical protein [Polyangia bacterium]